LGELNPQSLVKTGLAFFTASGNLGGEYYKGRIIFPYYSHGTVCYMAGRETEETPAGEGVGKYKYLRVHSEKNTRISVFVNNNVFFGEDKIKTKNTDFCVITEGLADCIIANQWGFPCLALGSTGTSKEGQERLVALLKNEKCVYLCFDNDENKAGQNGAVKTGQLLFNAGIPVKIIDLPRGSEKKIDIAEFMKGKGAQDFEALKEKALRFIPYTLNLCPKSEDKVENIETAEKFIKERLLNVDQIYRNGYVTSTIKNYFTGFTNTEAHALVKLADSVILDQERGESKSEKDNSCQCKEYYEESEEEGEKGEYTIPSLEERLKAYSEKVINRANKILDRGRALKFMTKTFNKLHM